jgi:hypothetical protein
MTKDCTFAHDSLNNAEFVIERFLFLKVYTRPMYRVPLSVVLRHFLVLPSTPNRKLPQVAMI